VAGPIKIQPAIATQTTTITNRMINSLFIDGQSK
jgi:hypothetical protein